MRGCAENTKENREGDVKPEDKFLVWLLALSLVCLCSMLGFGVGRDRVRSDAIKHGAAEWRCDPQTGTVEFKWLGTVAVSKEK